MRRDVDMPADADTRAVATAADRSEVAASTAIVAEVDSTAAAVVASMVVAADTAAADTGKA
jgi:hypothetical protein